MSMHSDTWWIWAERTDYNTYNDTVVIKRDFVAKHNVKARILITADSYYRLYCNGIWIGDGPARSWPEKYSYDTYELTDVIRSGDNEVSIIARYYGCGTFYCIPRQAGVIAELQLGNADKLEIIGTNHKWRIADALTWIRNTPKISIQMEPAEFYDASLPEHQRCRKTVELFRAGDGPWRGLHPRRVAGLTKIEQHSHRFVDAAAVARPPLALCIPHTRLMNPGLIEANGRVFSPFGIATCLTMKSAGSIRFSYRKNIVRGYFKISVGGRIINGDGELGLPAGSYLVLAFARDILNNDKSVSLVIESGVEFVLRNPLSYNTGNPWCYLPMREYAFAQDDMIWRWFSSHRGKDKEDAYLAMSDALLADITDIPQFKMQLSERAHQLTFDDMFVTDSYGDFSDRKRLHSAVDSVINPEAAITDDDTFTTVKATDTDTELVYDLGRQSCGYIQFELESARGTTIDIHAVEHINSDGRIQFTGNNRNGFRYITREGHNRYMSLKRRAGRYIFITLRNVRRAVKLRNIKFIESTYPAREHTTFTCNDEQLNQIVAISQRTLKLCMEDVYTDCPLYEQTLWVGDLRNEALYGYYAFGAVDIACNSLTLAGESTTHYGMTAAQAPSCWNMILPAWSFLWNIAVWEYYWYTGDREQLQRLYPFLLKNTAAATAHLDDHGLFSAPFWNMFDWARIDQEHQTVLHNSMLMVGALQAAARCAESLGDIPQAAEFTALSRSMTASINRFWDSAKKSYPDSLHADGQASSSISQHTSFLSILYNIIPQADRHAALRNIIAPPDNMIKVGSPFATMYMYEALELCGCEEHIINHIRKTYTPMLNADATTVWESYPDGSLGCDKFPTRSHCHGWSSAPPYFFQRIILGVRQTKPGCRAFVITPKPCGLWRAAGVVTTPHGDLRVSWEISDRRLHLNFQAPAGVRAKFKTNESLAHYKVTINEPSLCNL
jgi:alpha-L-rhamnosidase